MKTEFTKEFIAINCGCFSSGKIENVFSSNNFTYNESGTISLNTIINFSISVRRKVWFLYNQCELTDEEKNTLCTDLSAIALPVFTAKYPDGELIEESVDLAFEENNNDAAFACRASLIETSIEKCLSAAVASMFCQDEQYKNAINDYLINFVQ